MKILILGGTGAIGSHLSEILIKDNHEVFVTSRHREGICDKICYIKGNAHDIDFVKEISTSKWDAIVDLMVYYGKEFKDRYQILQSLCRHYIFMSSARVYADSETPIKEISPRHKDTTRDINLLKSGEYAIAKAFDEDILLNSNNQNYTIIRPYITYSEYRMQLGVYEKESWLFRALNKRTVVFPKSIYKTKTTLTYGKDVSTFIAKIIGQEKAYGQVYHVTSGETLTWEKIIEIYFDAIEQYCGFRPKLKLVENDICENTYQFKFDRYYNRVFDNSKIRTIIADMNFMDTSVGIKHCIGYFVNSPKYLRISPATEALHDKAVGEVTPLSSFPNLKERIKYLVKRYL